LPFLLRVLEVPAKCPFWLQGSLLILELAVCPPLNVPVFFPMSPICTPPKPSRGHCPLARVHSVPPPIYACPRCLLLPSEDWPLGVLLPPMQSSSRLVFYRLGPWLSSFLRRGVSGEAGSCCLGFLVESSDVCPP